VAQVILIVEDNERNLKLFREVLQLNGFETLEARTAQEGLDLVASARPDLVVMDIQLPDLDGATALTLLRQREETATTPVVAVTAFAMKGDRERLLSLGFDDYIPKPIDVSSFADRLRRLLPGGDEVAGT
jgi:two-component system cell cycle response regulator DivK